MHWNEIADDEHRCESIGIELLMIGIVEQCNRIKSAMHWNEIADKHSCALHWDALLIISIIVKFIGIALLMMSIVVQCNRNI